MITAQKTCEDYRGDELIIENRVLFSGDSHSFSSIYLGVFYVILILRYLSGRIPDITKVSYLVSL